MTDDDRVRIVDHLALPPDAGDEIPGTGGARKVRLAGRGKGKSGGYRVVMVYSGTDIPVFLPAACSKGERANLSQAERNELRSVLGELARRYREGLRRHVQDRK